MLIEKELDNVKWFRADNVRIKVVSIDKISTVTVLIDNYNICFKMMMFEFLNALLDETGIRISTERNEFNQVVFKVDNSSQMALAKYIVNFIREWNIKVSDSTVADADMISDEVWYS